MGRRNIGKFTINKSIIDEFLTKEVVGNALKDLFSNCVIIKAESIYYSDSVEYVAYSDLFAEVPVMETPSWYEVELSSVVNPVTGKTHIEFVKFNKVD